MLHRPPVRRPAVLPQVSQASSFKQRGMRACPTDSADSPEARAPPPPPTRGFGLGCRRAGRCSHVAALARSYAGIGRSIKIKRERCEQ